MTPEERFKHACQKFLSIDEQLHLTYEQKKALIAHDKKFEYSERVIERIRTQKRLAKKINWRANLIDMEHRLRFLIDDLDISDIQKEILYLRLLKFKVPEVMEKLSISYRSYTEKMSDIRKSVDVAELMEEVRQFWVKKNTQNYRNNI